MQTFLPIANFHTSAAVLDYRRLGKQRIEAKQLLQCLLGEGSQSWARHPAAKMWQGHEKSLAGYGFIMSWAWKNRGYVDNQRDWFAAMWDRLDREGYRSGPPSWFGDKAFHASHRACLLAKAPEHYTQFGWKEKPAKVPNTRGEKWPYVWPVGIVAHGRQGEQP